MTRKVFSAALLLPGLLACAVTAPSAVVGGEATAGAGREVPVESAASPEGGPPSAAAAQPAPKVLDALPSTCASEDADTCMPGRVFADQICTGARPDVALALFAKGSPWTRIYLRGDVDGWNAEGGGSARARLLFDEEVIVLKRRAPPAGQAAIVVGGSAGYQVIRWDGNCYSLDEGEVTRRRPPQVKHSAIPWRYLGDKTKSALLADATVRTALSKRDKECQGATMGVVSMACEKADTAVGDAIVASVKGGLVLPPPQL